MRKNNLTKLLQVLLLVFVLSVTAVIAVSCQENEEPPVVCQHVDQDSDLLCDLCGEKMEKVVLSATSATIDAYEQFQLSITSGTKGVASWTSSNTAVATVDQNGLVTGIADGASEIKVTNENGSASCYITVESSYSSAVLKLISTDIALAIGDDYVLQPQLIYKGQNVTDTVSLQFFIVDGQNESIISINQDGNKAILSANEHGNTQCVVYVEYKGVQISAIVSVAVKQLGITFDGVNLQPSEGNYTLELSTIAIGSAITQIEPQVNVVNDKTIVEDAQITYQSNDTSIVKVENGNLVAVAHGLATVTGNYNGNTFTIAVSVTRPTVNATLTESMLQVGKPQPIEFSETLQGSLENVTIDGVDVSTSQNTAIDSGATIADGKLNLSQSAMNVFPLSSMNKDVELVLTTNLVVYKAPAKVFSLVIENEADYQAMGDVSKAVYPDDNMLFGGYFILGNNITVSGGVNEFINRSGDQNGIKGDGTQGFCGVLDGDGYVIDGISRTTGTGNAFITAMHKDGIIKNIGFTNVHYGASGGSFLIHVGKGTISDVYIQYAKISKSGAYDATIMQAGVTVERFVIDAYDAEISTDAKKFALVGGFGNMKINDSLVVILPKGYTLEGSSNNYYNPEICGIVGNNTSIGSFAFYDYDHLANSGTSIYNKICEKWYPLYWHVDTTTHKVTFGKI